MKDLTVSIKWHKNSERPSKYGDYLCYIISVIPEVVDELLEGVDDGFKDMSECNANYYLDIVTYDGTSWDIECGDDFVVGWSELPTCNIIADKDDILKELL